MANWLQQLDKVKDAPQQILDRWGDEAVGVLCGSQQDHYSLFQAVLATGVSESLEELFPRPKGGKRSAWKQARVVKKTGIIIKHLFNAAAVAYMLAYQRGFDDAQQVVRLEVDAKE